MADPTVPNASNIRKENAPENQREELHRHTQAEYMNMLRRQRIIENNTLDEELPPQPRLF